VRFHELAYPGMKDHTWVPDYFREITAQGRCFGIYDGDALVSVADSPNVPYLPDLVCEPGIMTLPNHRQKGYAAAVCAAYIQQQMARGLIPSWTCAADNTASIGLAQHLGFRFFGDLWRMT